MENHIYTTKTVGENGQEFEIKFGIPKFKEQGAESLFENHQEEVYRAIVVGITRMMNLRADRMACFAMGELVFELGKESSKDNLNKCIKYYESIEDYETCSFILNHLIKYVNS
jgi:hypothetical protein